MTSMDNQLQFSGLKVLLVEDNPTNRLVASKLLSKRCGIEPDTAENGQLALEAMRSSKYDIVFMDCIMPEMDGYEATRRIRLGEAGEDAKSAVIIAMTANSKDSDKEECISAGMTDYLSKPMRPDALIRMLERWGKE